MLQYFALFITIIIIIMLMYILWYTCNTYVDSSKYNILARVDISITCLEMDIIILYHVYPSSNTTLLLLPTHNVIHLALFSLTVS